MRLPISVLSVCVLLLQLAIEAQQSATSVTSTIDGVVIEAATGRPIRDVRVWTDISPAGEFTLTDQNGHFLLSRVPIGFRSIRVRKPGYAFARSIGLKPPGQMAAAAQIYLDAGKPFSGLIVRLVPEGSISGRVLPEGFA